MKRRQQQNVLKVIVMIMGVCLAGYIVGPPLYWQLNEVVLGSSSSCPPCLCDCSSSQPILSIPEELNNTSFTDCMRHDPEASEEMEKSFTEMLSEEVKLREAEALESQERADTALLEAKKISSQYQKEADKCNSGMETCEEDRERAEMALEDQKQLSTMWELRARQRGWKEGLSKSLYF